MPVFSSIGLVGPLLKRVDPLLLKSSNGMPVDPVSERPPDDFGPVQAQRFPDSIDPL